MAIQIRATQQFSSTVSGTTNTGVIWQVNNVTGGNSTVGTVSTGGLYTAPSTVPSGGSVTVTATSAASTTASASATVNISATPSVAVSVSPTSASVTAGKTQQFTGTVTGTTSTGVTWQVNNVAGGNSTVGTISTSGLYTAPGTVPSGGSVTVAAVSSYETLVSASATVAITAASTSTPVSAWNGWNFTPTLYASPSGSGTTCSASAPCTIDYAFNTKASAGSVVQAAAGTYAYGSNHLTLSKSGTSGNPIVLTCVTRGACYITGTATGNTDVMAISGNYITFDGFDISSVSSAIPNANMIIYLSGSHDILSRNAIHDVQPDCSSTGGGGIQTDGSTSYNTYDANLVYNIGNNNPACKTGSVVQVDGILDETNGAGDVIENNIVYNVYGGWGLNHGYAAGTASAVTIVNNLVFENGNGGIALTYGSASSIVKNNIMIDNGSNYSGGCGVYGYDVVATGMQISNNANDGNAGGPYCTSDSTGTIATSGGDLTIAPASTFVNWQTNGSGNYQQAAGAATIGTGSSTGAPNHDFAGNVRSGSIDIGPYQHTN
jgi:hypothetical protein